MWQSPPITNHHILSFLLYNNIWKIDSFKSKKQMIQTFTSQVIDFQPILMLLGKI